MPRRLENWNLGLKGHYDPTDRCLSGQVYGDPTRADGCGVVTSHIVERWGRHVRTASGSVYELGEPSDDCRKWLRERVPDWDPENPLTAVFEATVSRTRC